ncbi:hypothetical protein ACFRA5_37920, partial [Streptomyces mirabilis]
MRTWFITGTSSGFGRQMTELLLERGDRVAATLRNPVRLDDLAARPPAPQWRGRDGKTSTPHKNELMGTRVGRGGNHKSVG